MYVPVFGKFVLTLGRTKFGDDGGNGNSDSASSFSKLARSEVLSEIDTDRTGAMTEVLTERGGTIREDADREGREGFGREPGFDSVRVRCRAGGFPASLCADDTGGRDSVTEDVVRVTDGVWMPAT